MKKLIFRHQSSLINCVRYKKKKKEKRKKETFMGEGKLH